MNEGERGWNPEISRGIVFDGDVPIVKEGRQKIGTIMIFTEMKIWIYISSSGFYFLANYDTRIG